MPIKTHLNIVNGIPEQMQTNLVTKKNIQSQ